MFLLVSSVAFGLGYRVLLQKHKEVLALFMGFVQKDRYGFRGLWTIIPAAMVQICFLCHGRKKILPDIG